MYLFLFHGTPAHTRHMPSKLIIHSCRNCVQLHEMQKFIQSLKNRSDQMTKQAALHRLLALKTINYVHHCTKIINDQSSKITHKDMSRPSKAHKQSKLYSQVPSSSHHQIASKTTSSKANSTSLPTWKRQCITLPAQRLPLINRYLVALKFESNFLCLS
jgi:hypothetical protein